MPHRWLAMTSAPGARMKTRRPRPWPPGDEAPPPPRIALVTDPTALPFAEASLDLVVLPHTLELSADPHASLREVQRVLVHEGRVAIAGLNPASLWGLRQYRAHLLRGAGQGQLYLPEAGEFIGHWRLRDWLRLLQFELESLSFGCYAPACAARATWRALAGWTAWARAGGRSSVPHTSWSPSSAAPAPSWWARRGRNRRYRRTLLFQ
jgi:SAM-dependent methyltransferase